MQIASNQAVVHWEAAQAAVRKADAIGIRVNAAVVDVGGNLVAFLRMPGAFLHSIEIAIDKVYTAAGFGVATAMWPQMLAEHSQNVREGLPRRARMVAFAGGLPLRVNGDLLGGVGISGGSEEQDELWAHAALEAIDADDHGVPATP